MGQTLGEYNEKNAVYTIARIECVQDQDCQRSSTVLSVSRPSPVKDRQQITIFKIEWHFTL